MVFNALSEWSFHLDKMSVEANRGTGVNTVTIRAGKGGQGAFGFGHFDCGKADFPFTLPSQTPGGWVGR